MAFSEGTKHAAYQRARGRCECLRQSCAAHYPGRCGRSLVAGWHAHHVRTPSEGGSDELDNCKALCIPCHEAVEQVRALRARHSSRRRSDAATPRTTP